MSVTVADMVSAVRLQSGLRNNPLFSDTQIASLLDRGWKEQYDIFVQSFAHWFTKSYSFTLQGGTPENSRLDMNALVPDLQMVQGVNWIPGSNQFVPLNELGSFAERYQYGYSSTSALFGAPSGRVYFPNGDFLEIYPFQTSAGNYQLLYTPEAETLALPTSVSWAISSDTVAQNNSGTIQYAFGSNPGDHPAFSDDMLGGTITVTFGAPNAAYNCTNAVITGPATPSAGNAIQIAAAWPGGSFTSPPTGTATITYQPAGTRDDLPNTVRQWSLFIETHASIAIRESRKQECDDLKQKLEQERIRITTNAKQRAEGVIQAPITKRRGWGWGGYSGY